MIMPTQLIELELYEYEALIQEQDLEDEKARLAKEIQIVKNS